MARPLPHKVSAAPPAPAATPEPMPLPAVAAVWVRFHSDVPAGAKVGSMSAGLLCLPRGAMRRRDFLYGEIDAQRRLDEVLADHAIPAARRGRMAVALTGISAKLCARDWGAFGRGDTQSLTGTARIDWTWTYAGGAPHAESVSIAPARGHGRTPQEIMEDAMTALAERIAATA